jgi:hypothetical protein
MPIKFLNDVAVDSSVLYVDTINDRVGIGTTEPRVPLQVSSSEVDTDFLIECSNTQARMSINNTSTGDSQINFQLSNSSKFAIGVDNSDSDKFKISGSSALGSNDRLVVDSTGNVGIGTTSPNARLHVYNTGNGEIEVERASGALINIQAQSAKGVVGTDSNHTFSLKTNSSERLTISSGGNVGIGTTSPENILHLKSPNPYLILEDTSNANKNRIANVDGNMHYHADYNNQMGNSRHIFYIDNSEKLRINTNGNVGIGTTSPSQKLHVVGSARVTGAYYDSSNSAGTSGQILSSTATGTDWIDQGDVIAGEADKAKSVVLRVKNSTASPMTKGQVICEAVSASPPSGNLIEVALADNNGTNTMPALGILNEDLDAAGGNNDEGDAIMFGKVSGIDTSAFDVGDEVFVSDTPGGLTITKPTGVKYIQKVGVVIRDDNTNGTIEVFGAGRVNDVPTPLYVDHANQRLGIGTTSPNATLKVQGPSDTATISTSSTPAARINNGGAISLWIGSNFYNYGYVQSIQDDGSNNLKRLSLQPLGGDVGIGTTSPSQKLDVNGNIISTSGSGNFIRSKHSVSAFAQLESNSSGGIVKGSGGNGFLIRSYGDSYFNGGNVGIGTTNPATKLHIGTLSTSGVTTEEFRIQSGTSSGNGGTAIANLVTGAFGTSGIYFGNQSTYTSQDAYLKYADSSNATTLNFSATLNLESGSSGSRMYINSVGNVGIGTTSPGAKLHVSGSQQFILIESTANSDATYRSKTTLGYYGSGTGIGSATNCWNVYDFNAGAERMRISSSGNVGINTTNPNQKLTIKGNDNYVATEQTNYVWGGTNTIGVRMGTSTAGVLDFRRWDGGVTHGTAAITQVTSDGGWGLDFRVDNKSTNTSATTSRMFLSTSGEVGIGTRNPSEKLHVYNGSAYITPIVYAANQNDWVIKTGAYNNTAFDQGLKIKSTSGGTSYMAFETTSAVETMVLRSGKVGIGTTNPTSKLTVVDDILLTGSSPSLTLTDATSSFVIKTNTSGEGVVQTNGTSKPIRFFRNNGSSESMRIDGFGNVGIGITAPTVKLHIGSASNSGSSTEEFRIQTATGSGYGGNAVVNLNTGAFGKSGIYFGNNGVLSYANQDAFLEYDDYSGQTKLNFGNTLTINKGTSSSIYINSFGRVGLGTTSPQYQLQLSTNSAAKPTSSSWTVVSDERVKTNIRPYETGLQELLQIEPKLFDYNGKAGFDATTKNNIGVIAQEIKDVMPETVKKYNAKLNEEDEEDTELYNFDSHALTFALINSVKELNAKIKSLETKIQTLENQ